MHYSDALAALPATAKWSSSFGYPSEGGYVEYHRDMDGTRYIVMNGDWMSFAPFEWTVARLEPMPAPR